MMINHHPSVGANITLAFMIQAQINMKIKTFLTILPCMVLLFSCKTASVPYTQTMKDNLAFMYKTDQDVQTFDDARLNDKAYMNAKRLAVDSVFRANCTIVKEYFSKYSFPEVKENGYDAALHFWTIVQHSDHDVEFQAQVLKAMEKQLKKNNVSRRNYAYLYDRIQQNLGNEQLYGTQIDWSTGKAQPIS